jgi:hypothetical protein
MQVANPSKKNKIMHAASQQPVALIQKKQPVALHK